MNIDKNLSGITWNTCRCVIYVHPVESSPIKIFQWCKGQVQACLSWFVISWAGYKCRHTMIEADLWKHLIQNLRYALVLKDFYHQVSFILTKTAYLTFLIWHHHRWNITSTQISGSLQQQNPLTLVSNKNVLGRVWPDPVGFGGKRLGVCVGCTCIIRSAGRFGFG